MLSRDANSVEPFESRSGVAFLRFRQRLCNLMSLSLLKMKALWSFETSTRRYCPEDSSAVFIYNYFLFIYVFVYNKEMFLDAPYRLK